MILLHQEDLKGMLLFLVLASVLHFTMCLLHLYSECDFHSHMHNISKVVAHRIISPLQEYGTKPYKEQVHSKGEGLLDFLLSVHFKTYK